MSDFESFKRNLEAGSGKFAEIADKTLHQNLHKQIKNPNIGKYKRVKDNFSLCPKPRRKCPLRSAAYGTLFCMAEVPCWRQQK